MDPLIIVFGLGVGVLVGLTGIGGGSLMTPLLLIFIGTQPHVAVGTDIAYGALTKTVGGWQHLRSGTVDLGVSLLARDRQRAGLDRRRDPRGGLPSPPDEALLWGVAGALAFTAVVTLWRALFMRRVAEQERESVPLTPRAKRTAVGLGVVLGFILGVTSVGSGALIGLALILVFRLTPHRVVGTDVFHAAVLLWAAGLAHVIAGNVDYGLMGNILVGSIPGVLLGERLARSVPAAGLRPALGLHDARRRARRRAPRRGSTCRRSRSSGRRSLAGARAYALTRAQRRRARERRRGAAAQPRLERDVAVLALRRRHALGAQRLERGDQLRPRLVRHDHVVDVAALGRRVGVREARLVVVDQLAAPLVGRRRAGDVAAVDDVDRALRAPSPRSPRSARRS